MDDALARHYDPEAFADEEPTSPRVHTEELAMRVRLDDGWHRETPDGTVTACGRRINSRLQIDVRSERVVEHPLASCECWTELERMLANEAYRRVHGRDFSPWRGKP